MKFLVAFAVFAVAFAEEVNVKSVNLPEPVPVFVRDGILRSLVPSVKVAEQEGQEISRDSMVRLANEPQEERDPKTVQDIPAEDRIQFAEAPSPQDFVKIDVPQVMGNLNEPVSEDLRFYFLNDLVDVEPLAAPIIPTEYDRPIPEDLKVKFVDVPSQIEPVKINVPQPSEVQDSPLSDDLRVKFVDGQEWSVSEDLALPFFYALLPQVNPIVIDVPQPSEDQDALIPEDLRVKFADALLDSADSAKAGVPQAPENQDEPISEDLKVFFADAPLSNVEPVRIAIPQVPEIPIASVSEDLRVDFVDDEPEDVPVKNADLSKPKPGKVFSSPMWR